MVLYIYVKQDEIKEKAIDGLNQKLATKVAVDGLIDITFFKTFPNITLELNKVSVVDKFDDKKSLANVAKINFSINPLSLFDEQLSIKSIKIKNGFVKLKTFKDGKSNYNILKQNSNSKTKSVSINLEEIIIENIDLVYDDRKNKIYISTYINKAIFSGKFYNKDFDIFIDINTDTKNLSIAKTSFLNNNKLKGSFDLFYKAENSCISFKKNDINIDGTNFTCFGDICTASNLINFNAKAKGNSLENALSLIPKNLFKLEAINGNGKYAIDISLIGKLNKPKINIDFILENAVAELEKFKLKVNKIYASGSFSNTPKNNLIIKQFSLESEKTNLKGNMTIPDLAAKKMELNIEGNIFMPLLEKFKIKNIKIHSGFTKLNNLEFNFNYRKQDSVWLATKLDGGIVFENIQGRFKKIDQDFKLDGNLKFANKKASVKQLQLLIGKNDISFSGTIKNALNFFQNDIFGTNDELIVNGKIESNLFNINDFSIHSNSKNKENNKDIDLLKWLNIYSNIDLSIDKLIYKKLEVSNVKAKIKSKKAGLFSLKNLKADALNGKANGNIELRFFNNKNLEVFLNTKMKNIDINKLFNDLDNFGQKTITSKNIKGNLNANLIMSMVFKNFVQFKPKDLMLQTDFVLQDGELIKLNSLQSLAKYLSVEQLKNIHFGMYKSSVSIVNETIYLKDSKIESNLVSLNFGGSHTFNNEINYAIKLNLKNLLATKFKKKKTLNKDFVNNTKGGINIFISMKGTIDNPIIKMDKESSSKKIKEDLKKEKENLKNIFKKDKSFFEDEEEFYFEEDEEFIMFE